MKRNNAKQYFSVILILLTLSYSCKKEIKHDIQSEKKRYHQEISNDSISPHGERLKVFGNDSIYSFSDEGILQYIEYLENNEFHYNLKLFAKDGYLERIEYMPSNIQNSKVSEDFYPFLGQVCTRKSRFDTIIGVKGHSIKCNILQEDFFEDGALKYIGYYGSPYAQNGPVGLQKHFSESGKLIKTENYIYPEKKQPYIIISEYYNNEKPKWEKIYVNHAIHESEEEEPMGTWEYYNEDGTLNRIEKK